jgi:hypothetical protein
LAAQRYNRWYSYPVQPFQVMGGITARFWCKLKDLY